MLVSNWTLLYLVLRMKHVEEFFYDLLEILNFCQNVNTRVLIELTISRIENEIEALSQILPIIPRFARFFHSISSMRLTNEPERPRLHIPEVSLV